MQSGFTFFECVEQRLITGRVSPAPASDLAALALSGAHFHEFFALYPERYEARLVFLRPVIEHVGEKFLACGDLTRVFARIRCPQCRREYLLASPTGAGAFAPVASETRLALSRILRHLSLWEEPPARGPPPGGTVYEPCYDNLPAAAESNDQPSAEVVQVFPYYDNQADPEPVYD